MSSLPFPNIGRCSETFLFLRSDSSICSNFAEAATSASRVFATANRERVSGDMGELRSLCDGEVTFGGEIALLSSNGIALLSSNGIAPTRPERDPLDGGDSDDFDEDQAFDGVCRCAM